MYQIISVWHNLNWVHVIAVGNPGLFTAGVCGHPWRHESFHQPAPGDWHHPTSPLR